MIYIFTQEPGQAEFLWKDGPFCEFLNLFTGKNRAVYYSKLPQNLVKIWGLDTNPPLNINPQRV